MRQRKNTMNTTAAALWASAFVIAGLIIMQAGRLPGNIAHAGTASHNGTYSLVTASTGTGGQNQPDEVLFVIDSRDQVLLVYEIPVVRESGLVLRDGGSLVNMFRSARP